MTGTMRRFIGKKGEKIPLFGKFLLTNELNEDIMNVEKGRISNGRAKSAIKNNCLNFGEPDSYFTFIVNVIRITKIKIIILIM